MTFGVDYAWGRPAAAALQAAGVRFVCRYLSYDTTGKNLTRAEADKLTAAGISMVVVWESGAQRALSGHDAGVLDARAARSQAEACGMPPGRPIYFAVDFDATAGQQAVINAYLDGCASVLGRDRVGLYAGYWPVKRAFDAKKIAWGWQTYAWSGGHWDPRAQLQQYSNSHLLNGVGVDYDRATTSDYGQWQVGRPPKEDDMPLSADDKKWLEDAIFRNVWKRDELPAPGSTPADTFDPANPGFDPVKNPTWAGQSIGKQTIQGLLVVLKKLDALATTGGTVDLDALAEKVADVLAARLES